MNWFKKYRERRRFREELANAQREGRERRQKLNLANLRVQALDSRLALAELHGNRTWAERIIPELQAAHTEYRELLAEEIKELNEKLHQSSERGENNG
ncbi:MAG: hypothetical protein ACRD5M_05050 [Candidatus Acidiferrales bacterium]